MKKWHTAIQDISITVHGGMALALILWLGYMLLHVGITFIRLAIALFTQTLDPSQYTELLVYSLIVLAVAAVARTATWTPTAKPAKPTNSKTKGMDPHEPKP